MGLLNSVRGMSARMISVKALASAIALAALEDAEPLLGATRTWTGASINDPNPANRNNFWTTAANWSGNAFPVPGDDMVFPNSALQAASQNTFAPGTTFGKITIGSHTILGANITLTGGIDATGGNISLNGIKVGGLQTFTVIGSASTVLIASPIDTNGQILRVDNDGTLVFSGVIGGNGEVTALVGSSGTTIMTGSNTFAALGVLDGRLLIAGSQPNTITRVQSRGTLVGAGTVGRLELFPSLSGFKPTVAPGNNSSAILNVAGPLAFVDNAGVGPSLLAMELNGTAVGSGYDQLNVTGTVDLGTLAQLSVTIGAGFIPNPGDTFILVKNDGTDAVTGIFQDLPEGATFSIGSVTLQISYAGGDGNDITLTAVNGLAAFTASTFSVNEGNGLAAITVHRTGNGGASAMVGLALEDITTSPADYVSPAGKLDTSFTADAASTILKTVIQRDGKIVLGGIASPRISRLNADGTVDPSFILHQVNNDVRAVAIQPDGKIIIGGMFTTYDGTPRGNIARINSDGSLDTTFDPGTGLSSGGAVQAIAIQPDGKIIIGGLFVSYNGTPRGKIARLNANGSLDTGYVPDTFDSTVFDIVIDENGKAVVGGAFDKFGTAAVGGVARLNTNGSLDTSFNPGGIGAVGGTVLTLTLQPDNKIVIGGFFTQYNGSVRNRIARLGANGTLDPSFDPGAGCDGEVEAIRVDRAARLVIGGKFRNYDNVPRRSLARVLSNGALDRSFDPGTGTVQAGSNSDTVTALALTSDGATIVGGFFGKYDGVTRHNIARVQGDLTATWGPNDFADKTIPLPIVNDTLFEGNEKVRLRIVPLTAGVVPPSTAELTIVDNDSAPTPTATPTATPSATPTATPTATPAATAAKAQNIATRLRVETGDNVMIAGFIITGNENKDVVLRGRGPVLGGFGINDFLADPVLDLRGSGGSILMNNNWKDTQRAQIEGGPFEPTDDRESVILATLAPGAYTGVLTGNNNTTGVGLIEVFDNGAAADSQLANISTRGLVQGNNSVMIGGFILGGSTTNSRIAIRAIGPSLAQFFGANKVLADPTLELHDGNGATLISNDDWESDSTSAAQLSANGLGLGDSKEAGIFTPLAPGQYTAILAGKSGGTGIGLIEVYNLQ